MIDKIRKGSNTAGLLYYLYGPGKSDEHTDPHLVAGWRDDLSGLEPPVRPSGKRDLRMLTGLLDMPLKMTGRHHDKDTVWHCVLSAAPEDRLMSDEQWNTIATEFMDLMGLAPSDDPAGVRWVAVRHGLSKDGIDHVHIVATLARQDGTLPSIHNDFLRARRACRQIEQKHGLRVTAPADRTAAPRPSRAETERSARTGTPEPPRITLRRYAQDAVAAALSEDDFFARLRDAGALIRFRYGDRNPGQVTGYALALPGYVTKTGDQIWFSGGKLAPDLTIPKLRHHWNYDLGVPNPRGRLLSDRSARAFLRSAACSAAERTTNETNYFTALNDAGVAIRYRRNDDGAITGYSLRLSGQESWYGGGQLGSNLTLPRLHRRWATPARRLKPPVTPAEYQAIWTDVITIAEEAARQMRADLSTAPAAAADTAWATADVLRVAARAVRGSAGHDLLEAADEFHRAARSAQTVVPSRSRPGETLRIAAQLLSIIRPGCPAHKLRMLLAILADLAAATAELRTTQRCHHQGPAAIIVHATLTNVSAHNPGASNRAIRFAEPASEAQYPSPTTSDSAHRARVDSRRSATNGGSPDGHLDARSPVVRWRPTRHGP